MKQKITIVVIGISILVAHALLMIYLPEQYTQLPGGMM